MSPEEIARNDVARKIGRVLEGRVDDPHGDLSWLVLGALLAHPVEVIVALGGEEVTCNGDQATALDFTDACWFRFATWEET